MEFKKNLLTNLVEAVDKFDHFDDLVVSGAAFDEATKQSVALAAGNGERLALVLPQDLERVVSCLSSCCRYYFIAFRSSVCWIGSS